MDRAPSFINTEMQTELDTGVEAVLASLAEGDPKLGDWITDPIGDVFFEAAYGLLDAPGGQDVFVTGRDVTVPGLGDLLVRYLGEAEGPPGEVGHAVLFHVPGRLQVPVWINESYRRERWRGDREAVERVALLLSLLGDHWFEGLA